MELIRSTENFPERFRQCALSIGNFDGVHQGHAHLAQRLVATARQLDCPAVAMTFDPHPAQLLRPDAAPKPLCWTERNAHLLGELGVDAVIAFPTNMEFLKIEAREFFDLFIRECFDAKAMVEGHDFFFGANRSGNTEVLAEWCDETGISLEVVEPIEVDGERVSSSRIRSLVNSGEIRLANKLLKHPYRIRGTVVHGAARGAKLGFPTANLEQINTLLPCEGIYAARAYTEQPGSWHAAAVNIGPNVTFDEGDLKVEAYLIDFDGDLYDQQLELDFLARLRDITRFDSAEQLIAQMQRDVAETREIVC